MKHIILILVCLSTLSLQAQFWNGQDSLFGNEWIRYEQSYYKMAVADDGIYRISYNALQQAGIPVGSIPASQFQLFHLGEEVPVYLSTSGNLSDGDYLEFYGRKNRSEFDRYLFEDPDQQMLNPHYSLFTDTAAYFLTWPEDAVNSERITEISNELSNLPPKEEYYLHTTRQLFTNKHLKLFEVFGGAPFIYSHFELAEGFASKDLQDLTQANGSVTQSFSINPDQLFENGPGGEMQIRYACGPGEHRQIVRINGSTYDQQEFSGFAVKEVQFAVPSEVLSSNSGLEIEVTGQAFDEDRQSIASAALTYPRRFVMNGQDQLFFTIAGGSGRRYIEVEGFGNGTPVLYDLSNYLRMEGSLEGDLVRLALPASAQDRQFLLVNEGAGINQVGQLAATNFIDYEDVDAEYVILSHPKLFGTGNETNWVQEYADYRASVDGGSYQTLIVDVQQLYDQFGYGINRHSLSIRNFSHYIFQNWTDPQYLFIVGKGREYLDIRRPGQVSENLEKNFFVPTFGTPASDNLLTARKGRAVPLISTGRIAATSPNDIRIYLDKVKAHEMNASNPQTVADKLWMKRALHLGGGGNADERSSIKTSLNQMARQFEIGAYGGEVTSFLKPVLIPFNFLNQIRSLIELIQELQLLHFSGIPVPLVLTLVLITRSIMRMKTNTLYCFL